VRAHVCQLTPAKLLPLMEFHPASFDHMDYVSEEDVAMLAKFDTVATLLPAANYFLGLASFPPARKLIDAGVAVALATDYNPGTAPTPSMPFVFSVACTHMKMTAAEAITAATYNGACALRLQGRKGSIELVRTPTSQSSKRKTIANWHIGSGEPMPPTLLNGVRREG